MGLFDNFLDSLWATLEAYWAVLGTFLLKALGAVLASSAAGRNACKANKIQAYVEPFLHKENVVASGRELP